METAVKGASTCARGAESYEYFYRRNRAWVQYDYRSTSDGELFSCIAAGDDATDALIKARAKRDEWLRARTY